MTISSDLISFVCHVIGRSYTLGVPDWRSNHIFCLRWWANRVDIRIITATREVCHDLLCRTQGASISEDKMNNICNFRLACICGSSGSVHVIRISTEPKRGASTADELPQIPMVEEFARMDLPGDIFSSPVMIGGRIFLGCRDDYVHCIAVVP